MKGGFTILCYCYVCLLLNMLCLFKIFHRNKCGGGDNKRKNKQLPFPSQLNLAFLIEDELGIIISPSIPFQNFLPNKKKYVNESYAKHLKTEE